VHPGEYRHQRGFSRTVSPKEGEKFAAAAREVDVGNRLGGGKGLRNARPFQQRILNRRERRSVFRTCLLDRHGYLLSGAILSSL
jgi:hypothetical protein